MACLCLERRPQFWVDFDLAVSVFGAPGKTLAKQDLLYCERWCWGEELQQQQNGYIWQVSKQNSYNNSKIVTYGRSANKTVTSLILRADGSGVSRLMVNPDAGQRAYWMRCEVR